MNFIVTRSIEPSAETFAIVALPPWAFTHETNDFQSVKRSSFVRI